MDKIMAMREKRAEMWEQAKQFLDSHEKDGRLTAEDAKAYEHFLFHIKELMEGQTHG